MTEDIEITFARRLGDVLGEMRATLDEKATRRALVFILSRYGIDVINNTFYCSDIPKTISIRVTSAANAPTPPLSVPTIAVPTRRLLPQDTCPICGFSGVAKGVVLHMVKKHGTTPKEYARTKALDEVTV